MFKKSSSLDFRSHANVSSPKQQLKMSMLSSCETSRRSRCRKPPVVAYDIPFRPADCRCRTDGCGRHWDLHASVARVWRALRRLERGFEAFRKPAASRFCRISGVLPRVRRERNAAMSGPSALGVNAVSVSLTVVMSRLAQIAQIAQEYPSDPLPRQLHSVAFTPLAHCARIRAHADHRLLCMPRGDEQWVRLCAVPHFIHVLPFTCWRRIGVAPIESSCAGARRTVRKNTSTYSYRPSVWLGTIPTCGTNTRTVNWRYCDYD